MSLAKNLICRPYNQLTNQIPLLCSGKDHCKHIVNAAKPTTLVFPKSNRYDSHNFGLRWFFFEWGKRGGGGGRRA